MREGLKAILDGRVGGVGFEKSLPVRASEDLASRNFKKREKKGMRRIEERIPVKKEELGAPRANRRAAQRKNTQRRREKRGLRGLRRGCSRWAKRGRTRKRIVAGRAP